MPNLLKLLKTRFQILSSTRKGFTLLELTIFAAMFTMTAISFITILLSMTRVQLRQEGAAEVNQQSQFLLQTVQRYVEKSSLVEMAKDSTSSTLKLRMSASSSDPSYIYASGTAVYLKEKDSGTPQRLTSSRVLLSDISFVKRENAGAHDSVSVSFTVAYNNTTVQNKFIQALQTSITRVSAATFDSNIQPNSGNTYHLGASAGDWRTINNTIYFNGSNVGIGSSFFSPNARLQVSGGDIYVDTTSKGIMLRSPDNTCWRVTVTNGGAFTAASTTCP